jgi:anti-sigma B factor antagonist
MGCRLVPDDKRPEQYQLLRSEGGLVILKTSTRVVNGIVIVDIIGQLRLGEGTNVVRDLVRDLMGKNYKNILLNLADVRYIDSAGVGELMSCYTSVRNQGGQFKLMNLSKNVHNLLQITKLYTVFEVEEDEARAIQSFQSA